MSTIAHPNIDVTGGIDTHDDLHVAAAIDSAGRLLGWAEFPADERGYATLLDWLTGHGHLVQVGVEGTGAYGAGLNRYLRTHSVKVVEVDRPDRKTRRFQGKSDPIDAEAAARAALAGRATGTPKTRDGQVEALRALHVARRSAVKQRAATQTQMRSLIVTAPDTLRRQLRGLPKAQLIAACAGLTPDHAHIGDPTTATMLALRGLAHRHQHLSTEITDLDTLIAPLVAAINPDLLAVNGVGPDVAAQLLVTAGDNPDRLTSEAAFSMLCGVAPLPASSGKTQRHRLNRGGDRDANCALYRITMSRLRWNPRTRDYANQRTKQGLSKKEIIRCLKRYIAREIFPILTRNDIENAP